MSEHPTTEIEVSPWSGELKSLGGGRVGGLLVRFGSPDETDLSPKRDFFTPETDFGLDLTTKSAVLWFHGCDPRWPDSTRSRPIGVAELKTTDAGVWMEAVLKERDEYERGVRELVDRNAVGLSSGTAAHRVVRERQSNGSNKILAWPLGLDASITHTPAEPRTYCVPLKSLLADFGLPDAPHGGRRLSEHVESVRAAVETLIGRLEDVAEMRRSEGRRLSPERRAAIKSLSDRWGALCGALERDPEHDRTKALADSALASCARLASLGLEI